MVSFNTGHPGIEPSFKLYPLAIPYVQPTASGNHRQQENKTIDNTKRTDSKIPPFSSTHDQDTIKHYDGKFISEPELMKGVVYDFPFLRNAR